MKRPVFIVGCPRSGTTLLYSMLVSAGGFAVYRKETYLFDVGRRFSVSTPEARERFVREFLSGYLGKVPGMNVEPLARQAVAGARSVREFLPRLMGGIAAEQGVDRWVEATPNHILYMDDILKTVPDALFVHVVRDGRDTAVSTQKQRWAVTLPGDSSNGLAGGALYWEWMTRAGRRWGRAHADRYVETTYEALITEPAAALERIGRFIDHDLDYERMQANPMHALRNPNTSFKEEYKGQKFNPVGRWKDLTEADLRLCEQLIGPCLEEFGYARACPDARPDLHARRLRAEYLGYYRAKHLLKTRTPLGRMLTRPTIWSEQPKANERPFVPQALPGTH